MPVFMYTCSTSDDSDSDEACELTEEKHEVYANKNGQPKFSHVSSL